MRMLASLFKNSPWLMGVLTFFVIALSILPTIAQWSLSAWLSNQTQAPAQIENIDLNFFTGRLTIENISLQNQNQSLQIDTFKADLSMRSLLDTKLFFENVSLKGVQLPIQLQNENSELIIAGFKIPLQNSSEEGSDSTNRSELPIAIGIEDLQLQNIQVNFTANKQTHHYQIQNLSLAKLYSWEQNFGRLILASELDKRPINANLQLHLFAKQPKIVGTLTAKDLNLKDIQNWLPAEIQSVSGTTSIDSTFTLEQKVNGLTLYQYAEIDGTDFGITTEQQTLNYQNFSWKGDTHLFIGETRGLKLQGDASIKGIKAEMPASQDSSSKSPQTLSVDLNSQINLNAQLDDNQIKVQQTGPIRLTNLAWNNDQQKLNAKSASFSGDLLWDATDNSINAKGDLKIVQTNFQEPLQKLSTSLSAALNLKVLQKEADLSISQKGVIGLSDFNLQTTSAKQTLSTLNWEGDLDIQTQNLQTLPAGTNNQPPIKTSIHATGNLRLNQSLTELSLDKSSESFGENDPENSNDPTSEPLRLKQNLASKINFVGVIDPEKSHIEIQTDSKLSDLIVEHEYHNLKAQQIAWQDKTVLTIPTATNEDNKEQNPLKLSTRSNFVADQLELLANNHHPMTQEITPIVSLAKLSIEHLEMPEINRISLKNPTLHSLAVFNIQQPSTLLTLKQSKVDEIKLALEPAIEAIIGNVQLQDISGTLQLNQDKSLQEAAVLQQSLLIQPDKQIPATSKTTSQPESKTNFALKSLKVTGDNHLKLVIKEGEKDVIQDLTFHQLNVGSLNTESPNIKTPYSLKLGVGQFGQITSKGDVSPIADSLYLKTETEIDGLSLLDYSPLTENTIGYQIESGQLSAKISGSINKQLINFSNKIDLSKFTLTKANNEKSADFDKNFQMPLNVGLSLLKDKRDNIRLKLPIKGDLNNPKFNLTDIVGTALNGALGKATRTYLLVALQPFGALAMAGEFAFDQMNAVKLESIVFKPGNPRLGAKMQNYLNKLSKLLVEKSKLQIKLCTGASEQDRTYLQQIKAQTEPKTSEFKSSKPEQNATPPQKLNVTDNEVLKLAQQRQNAIKSYLIKQGVKGSQIILCQPKIVADQVAPMIEMGI